MARVQFQPVFSATAAAAFARLADFAIDFDHVHVTIIRPPSEVVKDTLVAFKPGQASITLDLTVPVRVTGEVFKVTIDYVTTQSVVFHGEGTVTAHAPEQPAPPQQITIEYKGPGFNVARIVVAPKTVNVVAPTPTMFTFSAFDASSAPVTNVPINWTTSDASIATISSTGVLTPTGKRGTVTVTALTPNNITDNGSAVVTLPPTSIVLVSGGGQTGKAGSTLSQSATVKVLASDGVGVAGVTVNFAAPTGGKVGSATVVTDANGQATTSLTLGGAIGPQAFAAATGGFSVAIPATAITADASTIAAVSGGGQSDIVRHALKDSLVVKVSDQFGNPVGNTTVTWTRTGTGTLGATSSTTTASGLASVGYTLGTVVGAETITATAAGITTPASFTVQALPAAPSALAVVSGSGQSGRAGQPLSAPFVVHVTDDAGNVVSGATVTWTAVNGTIPATTTTDAQGNSSNTLTLGATIGNASATATVNGKSVTFSAAVQVGIVAKAAFRTNPPNGAVGQPLTPAVQVELQDVAGNRTAAVNAVTIALGANPGNATLTGTLTRQAVAGVATFDDLALSAVGTGYTLVASSAGVPDITSTPFNIGVATTSTLTIIAGDQQTGVVNGALPTSPSVKLLDANQRPQVGVQVTFTPTTGTVIPATPVFTDTAGIARLVSWTFGQVAGPQTLVASAPNAASVTFHGTATAGPPSKLAIVTQPSANATSGAPLTVQPVIQLLDQFNNPAQVDQIVVTATYSVGTASNNSAASAAGVATFTNLTLNGAGTGTILFSSPNLQSVTSSSITVLGTSQNVLQVIDPTTGNVLTGTPNLIVAAGAQQPANTPVVVVTNSSGQPVPGVLITVTVTGPVGTSGTFTTNAQGIVAFLGLTAPTKAGDYTITATGTGLQGSPRTVTLTVVPGPATQHQWIQQIPANSAYASGSTLPTVSLGLLDQYQNSVTTSGVTIGITLDQTNSTNPNAQLGGTTTAQTVSGVATFSALTVTLSGTGQGYRLNARNLTNTANPAPIFGNPFNIAPAQPPANVTSQTTTISVPVGSPILPPAYPSFKVVNSGGTGVVGVALDVTFRSSGVCAPTNPTGTIITTDANGIATILPGQLTFVTSNPGSCRVTAGGGPFDLNLADANIVVAPAGMAVWTGNVGTDWATGGNWLAGTVPTATSQVFLEGWVVNQPQLANAATIGGLTIEPSSIGILNIVGNFVLTINGNYIGNTSSGGIYNTVGSGSVLMNGPSGSTLAGLALAPMTIGSPACGTTAYLLTGVSSAKSLTVNCSLDFGTQGSMAVTGDATVQNQGTIRMMQPNAAFTVGGNATFQGAGETNLLTDGAIVFGGNLTMQSGSSFVSSGNHSVAFNGQGAHSVTLGGLTPASFHSVSILPGLNLTFTPGAFNITGVFNSVGTLNVASGASISMTGSAVNGTLSFGSVTVVTGSMTLGGGAAFVQGSSTTGSGTMTALPPCQKSAVATVNVTGGAGFTAGPGVCTQTP